MSFTPDDYRVKAQALWRTFTPNERVGVALGIFPFEKLTAAEQEGYQAHPLVVALMRVAAAVRLES